jgi:nitrite reductase/ring-hydroxylating ferredoxin subunit
VSLRRLVVCRFEELGDHEAMGFRLGGAAGGHDGFVVRVGESVFAYRNICPHAGNPLHWKPHAFLSKKRDLILCSVHGATFDIETGRCVGGPCPGRALTPLRAAVEAGAIAVYPD